MNPTVDLGLGFGVMDNSNGSDFINPQPTKRTDGTPLTGGLFNTIAGSVLGVDDNGNPNPFDLSKIGDATWLVSRDDLWNLIYDLDKSRHRKILSAAQIRGLRRAEPIEIRAGKLTQQRKIRR